MNIYDKKENLYKEYKILQKEYLGCDNWKLYLKLKERENKVYKKFYFFKQYLKAERKLNKNE